MNIYFSQNKDIERQYLHNGSHDANILLMMFNVQ